MTIKEGEKERERVSLLWRSCGEEDRFVSCLLTLTDQHNPVRDSFSLKTTSLSKSVQPTMSSTMDILHMKGVETVAHLQNVLVGQEKTMFFLSHFFDPRYAFLILSPLIFSLCPKSGKTLIWTTVFAEWINQVMKWIMMGERPYWWVHTTDTFNASGQATPVIKQFHMTCETGPGSPSGHAMVTAATYFVIVNFVIGLKDQVFKSGLVNVVLWIAYLAALVAVSVSRVFIAAHFPHQCVYGAVVGLIVAVVVSQMDVGNVGRTAYILGTIGMFASAMATYAVIKNLGINPLWTVDRAMKFCSDPKYVHLDTTPFFSMTRYLGFFLGTGLALNSGLWESSVKSNLGPLSRIWVAVLSLMATKASERILLPKNDLAVFYGLSFVVNAMLPIIFIAIIPFVVSLVASVFARSSSKKKLR